MRRRVLRGRRLRRWAWVVIDSTVWFVAIFAAVWLRYDFDHEQVFVAGTLIVAITAVAANLVVGMALGPYSVGHQAGSFEEATDIVRTGAIVTITLEALAFVVDPILIPRSIPLIAGTVSIVTMFAARFFLRTLRARQAAARTGVRRVIVFGAGNAGRHLVRRMVRGSDTGFIPVALLDDDRSRRRLAIDGVRVQGDRNDIAAVADRCNAEALVVALPLADAALIRDLTDRAADAGLDVLILPPLREMMTGTPTSHDLRDVKLEDLLGRRPISLDTTAIAEHLAGRSVLVTGAGGSIGSELCRQIAKFGPSHLYMLDRDESALQAVELNLTGHGLLDDDQVVLADIRDIAALRAVFARTRPDVVFHAAALKHLPLLESYPLEAWKSNVEGTLNVLTAAAEVGVGTFVNISTDKAADPTSILGCSKRVAERLTAEFAQTEPGRYVSVRFGNVLGSRGSVVHLFAAQIERGGPITITHPDIERFFMLIPEACQLVLEAGATGADGEVMVLDMGEQVKIVDVAKTLVRISGRQDIEFRYTGLRPGEKLSEGLFADGEDPQTTASRHISSVRVPALPADDIKSATFTTGKAAAAWMRTQARVGAGTQVRDRPYQQD